MTYLRGILGVPNIHSTGWLLLKWMVTPTLLNSWLNHQAEDVSHVRLQRHVRGDLSLPSRPRTPLHPTPPHPLVHLHHSKHSGASKIFLFFLYSVIPLKPPYPSATPCAQWTLFFHDTLYTVIPLKPPYPSATPCAAWIIWSLLVLPAHPVHCPAWLLFRSTLWAQPWTFSASAFPPLVSQGLLD